MADPYELLMSVALDAYRTEQEAGERLTARAEKYIAATSVILAITTNQAAVLTLTGQKWRVLGSAALIAGVALMGVVIMLCVHGMRIRVYPGHAPTHQLQEIISHQVDARDATAAVARMYLVMRDQAAQVNGKAAAELQKTTLVLIAGIFANLIGFVLVKL